MQLTPELLISAYIQGVFPMADPDGAIYWYDPEPRAILPLDRFHVPRRLARTVRQERYAVRVDTAFGAVIAACADPNRPHGWINDEIRAAYTTLHTLGLAHSVECWVDDELVGGLYGVAVRGLFAGESMFSRERDASKVALVHLVERLRARRFVLLDVQFMTAHLAQFGAVEVSRRRYRGLLERALAAPARFA